MKDESLENLKPSEIIAPSKEVYELVRASHLEPEPQVLERFNSLAEAEAVLHDFLRTGAFVDLSCDLFIRLKRNEI